MTDSANPNQQKQGETSGDLNVSDNIEKTLDDQDILITGGTGSFGRAATRLFLKSRCRQIRIFSRDEFKQHNMRLEFQEPRLRFHLGDVRDPESVKEAMKGIDIVFHAAALKHVPSCEFFPMQAVLTNVIGTHNVVRAAQENSVKHLVCLSSDKAAYSISAMGMTKGLAEKIARASARLGSGQGTVVTIVRYGNVLHSRGSVIPLFIGQIKAGQPLTVTNPKMTRFLLPLPQAIHVVLLALTRGNAGDLFVQKAPACTILDLATALKKLFSSDVSNLVIGMRHGEKLFETLATREELSHSEDLGDYFRVAMDDRDLNYGKHFGKINPDEAGGEAYTSHNAKRLTVPEIQDVLLSLQEVQKALKDSSANTV